MMPETGNNRFFWDTDRVIFMPAETLAAETAEWYLREAGIQPAENEAIIISPVIDGVGAVMVVPAEHAASVEEKMGPEVQHLSPAQTLAATCKTIKRHTESLLYLAYISSAVLYVGAWDSEEKLFMIEAYPFETATDIVFMLDVLLQDEFDWHLYIYGPVTRECRRLLHRRFSKSELTIL